MMNEFMPDDVEDRKDQCAEFDRIQELNTEAAKRIRHYLSLRKEGHYPEIRNAVNDLEDIADRIEKHLGVPVV